MNKHPAERIGIFGGSFDPVHLGHLIAAQDALEQLELDRLLFVPAAVSPFKSRSVPVEGSHRIAMLRLAIEDHPGFEVSDLELKRGGISYSMDTVEMVQARYPDATLFFILGADSLPELHRWRSVDKLLERATVVPVARAGENMDEVAGRIQLPSPWKTRLLDRLIRIHETGISSSDIRMRVAEGLSIRYLVPPEVAVYIAEHGLYR